MKKLHLIQTLKYISGARAAGSHFAGSSTPLAKESRKPSSPIKRGPREWEREGERGKAEDNEMHKPLKERDTERE